MRKNAFTLAEVLITLGIIGVVAVLTLPNLMSDYRKKTYVAQLQRVYNQIQTAAQNCMVDEDVDNLNDTYLRINNNYAADIKRSDYDSSEDYYKAINEAYSNVVASSTGRFLKKYFRVTKDCGTDDNSCYAASYKNIYGEELGGAPRGYCVNVNTGATICMSPFNEFWPATFYVDTNGKSGPNVYGRDLFSFDVEGKGNVAENFGCIGGACDASYRCGSKDLGNDIDYLGGCFDKVVNDGWKMDY